MEEAGSSKILVTVYQATGHNILQDSNIFRRKKKGEAEER